MNATGGPLDGNGDFSNVAGCNANGNNLLGVTLYGTNSSVTGNGGVAFGLQANGGLLGVGIGYRANGIATGATALGYNSQATFAQNLTNVAPGSTAAGSTQAVNGGQFNTGLASAAAALGGGSAYNPATGAVSTPSYTVAGKSYSNVGAAVTATNAVSVQYTPDANGNATAAVDLTKAGTIAPTTVSGVAAGAVTATSSQAVNGAQLFSTNRHVAGDTAALGGGAAFDPVSGTYTPPSYVVQGTTQNTVGGAITALNSVVASSLRYDPNTANTSLTFNPGGPAVGLHNVAPGLTATDAVNLGQLQSSSSSTLAAANGYTDNRVNALNFDLRRRIDATGARGAAIAGVPQSVVPGAGFVGGAIGGQGDQVAFAVGLSKVFDAKHQPVIKADIALGTRGNDATYNVGAGFHF